MADKATGGLIEHFSAIQDPRADNSQHILVEIITIAVCAAICGANNWVEVEIFGKAKQDWLATFLELPNGIPSHDTFGRVFGLIDAEQFQSCFLKWVQTASDRTEGQIVPIDGKKLRRSHDKANGKAAIHMVSAWATEDRLVLGQVKVDDKSNEITAIPELLSLLELAGCIVTIDAMGCQTAIAAQIIEKEADYVLAVKDNQENLHQDIQELFAYAAEIAFADCDYAKTVSKGHGRLEIRECWTLSTEEYFAYLRNRSAWAGLQTIAMVKSERRSGDDGTVETRYFISSLSGQAKQTLKAVRQHWSIENGLHWKLDIAFREDDSRVRKGNGAQNFAIVRHIALNLLNQEKTTQGGIQAKRLKAGWDEKYLLKVLNS
jgi:predicted transposase YbfD/YdcC